MKSLFTEAMSADLCWEMATEQQMAFSNYYFPTVQPDIFNFGEYHYYYFKLFYFNKIG